MTLSKELGISAAALSEIMRGVNNPQAEVALHIAEIVRTDKNMTTPKTLGEAKEMIDDLRAELKLLKSPPVAASKAAVTTSAPNPKSQPFDPSADPGFKRVQSPPPPAPKSLPASANTPYLVGEILKLTNLDDLLSMLQNPAHTTLQRSLIYAEVKERRALAAGG